MAILFTETWPFARVGSLTTESFPLGIDIRYPALVLNVLLGLGEVADRDVILDILRNGTSIFSDPARRPRIPAGQTEALADFTGSGGAIAVQRGDHLLPVFAQVGTSAAPGRHLRGSVEYSRTGP